MLKELCLHTTAGATSLNLLGEKVSRPGRLKVVTMENLTFENFLFQQGYHSG
jgi:hypothetical protein